MLQPLGARKYGRHSIQPASSETLCAQPLITFAQLAKMRNSDVLKFNPIG